MKKQELLEYVANEYKESYESQKKETKPDYYVMLDLLSRLAALAADMD